MDFSLFTLVRVRLLLLHRMLVLLIHRVIKMLLIVVTSYYPARSSQWKRTNHFTMKFSIFFSVVIFSPVTSKLAYAESVERITELWEHQALGGYATTEINVYELIKISSMTSYYNFAIHTYLYTLCDYLGCVCGLSTLYVLNMRNGLRRVGVEMMFSYYFFSVRL